MTAKVIPTTEQIAKANRLFGEGKTKKEIAKAVGLSIFAVSRILPKRSVGRPGYQSCDADLKRAQKLASLGLSKLDAARVMGISYSSFVTHCGAAYEEGVPKAVANVADALYKNAMEGNVTAQIFFLKARAGWIDKPELMAKKETKENASEDDKMWETILGDK